MLSSPWHFHLEESTRGPAHQLLGPKALYTMIYAPMLVFLLAILRPWCFAPVVKVGGHFSSGSVSLFNECEGQRLSCNYDWARPSWEGGVVSGWGLLGWVRGVPRGALRS